jgi:nitrous oxide reductase accessory protein NosL
MAHICGDRYDAEELKSMIDCQRHGFMGATNVVNYLSNHDHQRVMVELGNRSIFGNYDLEASDDRILIDLPEYEAQVFVK